MYSSEESDMLIVVNSDIVFMRGRQKETRTEHLHCGGIYLHVVVLGLVLVQTIKKARRGPNPTAQLGNGQCEVSVVYVIMRRKNA